MQLPVLTCDNCARCCHLQSSPPYMPTEIDVLPVRLRRQIEAYLAGPDTNAGKPCFWLGIDGKCTEYADRPEVCRQFDMGGEECLELREMETIPHA